MLPQIIFISLMLIDLGIHIGKHGQSREPYNAGLKVLDIIIVLGLLWFGGYFDGF